MATNNAINGPLRSAFSAQVDALQTAVTGGSSTYNIVYDSELYDINNDWDGTDFTAPVDGLYQFNLTVEVSNLTALNTRFVTAIDVINPSTQLYNFSDCEPSFVTTSNNRFQSSGSALIQLVVGQKVTVLLTVDGGIKDIDLPLGTIDSAFNFFQGYLVTPT